MYPFVCDVLHNGVAETKKARRKHENAGQDARQENFRSEKKRRASGGAALEIGCRAGCPAASSKRRKRRAGCGPGPGSPRVDHVRRIIPGSHPAGVLLRAFRIADGGDRGAVKPVMK